MTPDIVVTLLAGFGVSVLGVILFWAVYGAVTNFADYLRYRRAFKEMDELDAEKEIHR